MDTLYGLECDAYVRRCRNPRKRAYAAAYLAWLRAPGPALAPSDPPGLSYMGAQAVRLALTILDSKGY